MAVIFNLYHNDAILLNNIPTLLQVLASLSKSCPHCDAFAMPKMNKACHMPGLNGNILNKISFHFGLTKVSLHC